MAYDAEHWGLMTLYLKFEGLVLVKWARNGQSLRQHSLVEFLSVSAIRQTVHTSARFVWHEHIEMSGTV